PDRLKIGLVLFAGDAEVATPPTTDHSLVAQGVDDANFFRGFGGTAIGDAIATAVQVGLRSAGIPAGSVSALGQARHLASYSAGAVQDAYAKLGSKLGRRPGTTEVTGDFVIGAALLLVLAGVFSALWAPRLP